MAPRFVGLLGLLVVVQWTCSGVSSAQEAGDVDVHETGTAPPPPNVKEFIQGLLEKILDSNSEGTSEKILGSGISAHCGLRLLKVVNALRSLEPWVVRMIDATGKYPTGLFQGAAADLGAFDECIATVVVDPQGRERVRAHYCNLFLRMGNATSDIPDFVQDALLMTHRRAVSAALSQADERASGIVLGLCVPTECKEDDIEKLIVTLSNGGIRPSVKNCVTDQYPPPNGRQIGIITALAVLGLVMLTSTAIDLVLTRRGRQERKGTLTKYITAFSVTANTKMLLAVADKGSGIYSLRFLHGIRFMSMLWILFGHAYSSGTTIAGGMINLLVLMDRVSGNIIAGGYLSVDTFLFLGGFLLSYNMSKHGKRTNKIILWMTCVLRFYIRIIAPAFFMIMCVYLLPLIITGPRAQELYERMFADFGGNWWSLLLNIRNIMGDVNVEALGHLWYLSVVFQLFLVSVTVLVVFQRKPRLAVGSFCILSIASCAIATWKVYGTGLLPFPLPVTLTYPDLLGSINRLYSQSPLHGAPFFIGCITSLVLLKYKDEKMSTVSQLLFWASGITCANIAVFVTYDFNRGVEPAHWATLCATFFQRALWSMWLAWLTFACATARGGMICSFLSWGAFAPLSRLSYGVYLIQVPYYFVRDYTARERIFYSDFTVITQFFGATVWCYLLSYFLFIACEAPVGRLEKLVFQRERRMEKVEPPVNGKTASFEKEPGKLPLGYSNNGFVEQSNL
ncbi:nose resistant to fluoxetine protein 6-like [Ornithodoros turicata]|uniref:nose resistant to fluoxetine protein 6-like n=1 Tax=Ornithodoros turicata TaxID=34597 RepID=UPI003139DE7C